MRLQFMSLVPFLARAMHLFNIKKCSKQAYLYVLSSVIKLWTIIVADGKNYTFQQARAIPTQLV